MKLGIQISLDPDRIVLDGDPARPPPKGHSPQFSVHVYCGLTAGCIKMPLGTEVGLGPGDIVFDGDHAPPQRHSPHFRPMFIVAERLYVSGYHLVRR